MKKVMIDLTQIPLQRTGVGIYAVNYVRRLQQAPLAERLYFLILDDDHELLREARAVPHAVVIPLKAWLFRRFLLRVLLEQALIPYLALTRAIDAVHSLHYSFPLCSWGRFKRIVTVCDMSFFLFPELHVRVKRLFFQFFIRRLTHAEGLIFISTSTKQDFNAHFPHCRAAQEVVPLGADLAYLQNMPSAPVWTALRDQFALDQYILYVGTIEPRKNILGLIQAFERCAAAFPALKLVIAGKLGWNYEPLLAYLNQSRFRERIVLTGYINEMQKHALLKFARLMVYVSFYEGFGIPVLEGMAAGVATITSNRSSMPEVAGDGALLVDPENVEQIASGIQMLLHNTEACAHLIARGIVQSNQFTWERMTEKTLDCYRKVLAHSHLD